MVDWDDIAAASLGVLLAGSLLLRISALRPEAAPRPVPIGGHLV